MLWWLFEYSFRRTRYAGLWVCRHCTSVGFCCIAYGGMWAPSLEIETCRLKSEHDHTGPTANDVLVRPFDREIGYPRHLPAFVEYSQISPLGRVSPNTPHAESSEQNLRHHALVLVL